MIAKRAATQESPPPPNAEFLPEAGLDPGEAVILSGEFALNEHTGSWELVDEELAEARATPYEAWDLINQRKGF